MLGDGGHDRRRAARSPGDADDSRTSMKRHLIIAGTGRTGTSFLVRYLAECGLETHLSSSKAPWWDEEANAGLEDVPVWGDSCPYVAKSPWLFEFIDDLLARPDIQIDGVIVPVRDLAEAATSRSILELRARHASTERMDGLKTWETWGVTPGGTVYSVNPMDQARILAVGFHKVLQVLVRHDIKIALLDFPRLIQDPEYLYGKLASFLPTTLGRDAAIAAHEKVADPTKVRVGTEIASSSGNTPSEGDRKVDPRLQYPEFSAIDNVALKREIARLRAGSKGLQSKIDSITSERASMAAQRDALAAERQAGFAARDALTAERNALAAERDALTAERDGLTAQRDALTAERDRLTGERDALTAERDRLTGERDALGSKLAAMKRLTGWELLPAKLRQLITRTLWGAR